MEPLPSIPSFNFDAFISYSHKNRDVVSRLIARLKADGFRLWVDEEQIGGGDPLGRGIVNGIQQSRHVIVCLSPSYLESEWTTFESAINQAMDIANRNHRIIPAKVVPVELPVEYRQYYCPDLTNEDIWEQEYQKTVKNIRASRPDLDRIDTHAESSAEEPPTELRVIPFQPQPPEPTPRLASMGFIYHPFAWRDAERMNLNVLEQTYTPPSRFNETVMDLGSSTALLAPFGGGKTAGRLRLIASLMKKQAEILKESTKAGRTGNIPLVVQYTDFERLYSQLPAITLESHQPLLLACTAESLCEFICSYPELFMALNKRDRDFWWAFLENYRLGITLTSNLRDEVLLRDYQRVSSRPNPFIHSTSLSRILQVLVEQLNRLNIRSLIILVDGVDAQAQSQIEMETITTPLFNHLGILSVPGVIWKFFLPDLLENLVRQSSSHRTARLKILHIQWDRENLKEFLIERLLWASEGSISDIAQHCDQKLIMELGDVDIELAKLALSHDFLGSPRAMLVLADRLYHYGDQAQITLEDWRAFLLQIGADA